MKKSVYLFIKSAFIGLFSLVLICCSKEEGNPPSLPPQESMEIDFSNFISVEKSAELLNGAAIIGNWGYAAVVSGYFSSVVYTTLAIPVYAFLQITGKKPAYLDDNTWQWSYNGTVLGVNYKCRLTGQIREKDVLWKMYIAREGTGGYPEFVWFEGTSKPDGSGGQWILNHSYQFQEPLLQIDWIKTGEKIGTVKYTYIRALNDSRVADTFRNSYFEYGKTSGSYDSYYTIHYFTGTLFSDVNVEWNSSAHNGRVKSLNFFGDSNWHCWDSGLANITCP